MLQIIKKESLVFYSSASFFNTLQSLITAFIALRWVSPQEMGIWQSLILLISYADIAKLGVFSGLNRDLPYLLGAGKHNAAKKLVASAQFHVIALSLLGLIFATVSFFLVGDFTDIKWIQAITAITFYWIFSILSSFLQVTYRNTDRFNFLAFGLVIQGVFSLGGLLLVINWGFLGFLLMRTGALAIFCIYLFIFRPIRPPIQTEKAIFVSLVKTGLPIHGVSYIFAVAMGLDRLFLLRAGGIEIVGLFAPATQIMNIMLALPFTITAYMNPKLLKLLGNNNDPGSIRQIALNTAAAVGLTSSVFAIAGWFAVPLLIERFFPDYTAVIEATRIMLIAGVFLSFRTMTIVFNALKQWRYLYIFGLFFLLSRFASLAILTPLVGPLLGVTLGSVFSFFASALIIIGMVILATRPKEIDSM